MPIYCDNCDAEAKKQYVNHSGTTHHLCKQCATAFEWGQNNPKANLEPVDTTDDTAPNAQDRYFKIRDPWTPNGYQTVHTTNEHTARILATSHAYTEISHGEYLTLNPTISA